MFLKIVLINVGVDRARRLQTTLKVKIRLKDALLALQSNELLCVAVRKQKPQLPHCLDVLIYQNRVSIRINNHKARRASRVFVCF
jgi:hypothetical protein